MKTIRHCSIVLATVISFTWQAQADELLLKTHCSGCHGGAKPKGDFSISQLGRNVNGTNKDYWIGSLDYVKSGEMPPAKQSRLTRADRQKLVQFFQRKLSEFKPANSNAPIAKPRRLNNRELVNSIADVLLIEDIGTHEPVANLLGDTLHKGFDTNGDVLGISEFHLEQYINAYRKILDATILTGTQPKSRRIVVKPSDLRVSDLSNRRRSERANRTAKSIDILDLRKHVFFSNFESVPVSGRYQITIRASGIDRNVYSSEQTGHYEGDPIRVRVHLGDRKRDFDLLDNKITEIKIDEWLAAGTRLRITYLSDALRLKGNGNFKFQYRIAHDYLKENNPELYNRVVSEEVPKAKTRSTNPGHWVHWTKYWQGPRPRLFGAEIEGPFYESWPPKRTTALLTSNPTDERAKAILSPIARRAWRRELQAGELDSIVSLVKARAKRIGIVEAFKEGIVAILASPSFLLINPQAGLADDRFATKLSYFLTSSTPSDRIRNLVKAGKLNDFDAVRKEVNDHLDSGAADAFLQEFPKAWLQLDRINFMAPDPDRYPLYDRKRLSEDMVNEVLHFFDYAIQENVPVQELLTADYSFVNADLAKIYQLDGVIADSKFRKYEFQNGRRGGLLGMAAFLTLTADSLGTSPIHRAVYVMENFLGIHPTPPPGDVEIAEPDVRQAKTIKEILAAHRADARCASCHQSIDPYGYAFENFDPVGAWRNVYTAHLTKPSDGKRPRNAGTAIPIDSAGKFRNGTTYEDIRGFRKLMQSEANRERFIRCFIHKLLMYANGEEPTDYSEVDKILQVAASHDYRIVDTIAATINSPLFRGRAVSTR